MSHLIEPIKFIYQVCQGGLSWRGRAAAGLRAQAGLQPSPPFYPGLKFVQCERWECTNRKRLQLHCSDLRKAHKQRQHTTKYSTNNIVDHNDIKWHKRTWNGNSYYGSSVFSPSKTCQLPCTDGKSFPKTCDLDDKCSFVQLIHSWNHSYWHRLTVQSTCC